MEKITAIDDVELPIPILSWCPNLDAGSLEQAKNLAFHPKTRKHIALMPDAHQGYGMPIGGVAAFKDAVCPNAVGVDIGAVDKDTEVLTKNGWITIDRYQDEEVLVWDDHEQTSFFSRPLLYIVKPCENFTKYRSKYGLDQVLSDEHRMLVYEGYGKDKKESNTYFCKDFREKLLNLKKQDYYSVRTTFPTKEQGVNFTDEQLRIRIMVSADGCIRNLTEHTTRIEVHLKKERKIKRAIKLLEEGGIHFSEYRHKDQTKTLAFTLDWLCDKTLTDLFSCNQHQAKIVYDEYLFWDGSIDETRDHKVFSSTNKTNADVIQYICALNGTRAGIHATEPPNSKWNTCYAVYRTKNNFVGFTKPEKIKKKGENKYCFIVKTGYFIARRKGNIFITGNCGVMAQVFPFKTTEAQRKEWFNKVSETIPVGFKRRLTPVSREEFKVALETVEDWANRSSARIKPFQKELKNGNIPLQLGTLGGGNHFIELQENTGLGLTGIMVHSGSRHVGFALAKHYHELAVEACEAWASSLPTEDLAFFPANSPLGREYREAMEFAMYYASESRKIMLSEARRILFEIVGEALPTFAPGLTTSPYKTGPEYYWHTIHNYASPEHHLGSSYWIHRKGATQALNNKVCLIPGSMGTSSYIVPGGGKDPSFTSCSHGAGRTMGRMKFSRTHSKEACEAQLDGIIHPEWKKDRKGNYDLSEAPQAYKDIDAVMANQSDLVDLHRALVMKPLAVVKG